MPHDKIIYPMHSDINVSKNPVEMAKRIMDSKAITYRGDYLPYDDCYIITILQKRSLPNNIFHAVKDLGFSNTGRKKFFFKNYSVVERNTLPDIPEYGDGGFDSRPMNPAPDPYKYK